MQRHYADATQATSDLAAYAAAAALETSGVIAWVFVAISTPDHPQPATASLVQHRIGASNAATFDVNAVCAGFLTALHGNTGAASIPLALDHAYPQP